ncbi:MAG TPA: LptA/OstA family protein [Acidobacteriota bacterium]|nr:LptA/OstA family protein [Acidobacteriota bacterium]
MSVLVVSGLAILWNFLIRQRSATDTPQGNLLSPDVARLSTQFEYTQLERGRPIFRVVARTSVLTQTNVHTLEDVQLTRFDADGDVMNRVEGKRAVYWIDNKQINFEDDVVIELEDGTQVLSDRVQADLARQVINIDDQFRFQKNLLTGVGKALQYQIPSRRLLVDDGLQLTFPADQGEGSAKSQSAIYNLGMGVIQLSGQALIQTNSYQLSGDAIQVATGEERSIEHIRSTGNARLANFEAKSFRGERIDLIMAKEGNRLERFRVFENQQRAPLRTARRAIYEERVEQGTHRLVASVIEGIMDPDVADVQSARLRTLRAQGRVQMTSSPLQIEESNAERLLVTFDESSQRIQQLVLDEGVMIARRSMRLDRPSREVLRSERLTIALAEDQIQWAAARENIDVQITSPPLHRHLSARDSLDLSYENGVLSRALAKGDCLLETLDSEGQSSVRAPQIESTFQMGVVDHVHAGVGVEVEVFRGDMVRRSRSRQLDLDYEQGLLVRAVQSGDFEMFERSNTQTLDARADLAVYVPEREEIELSGESRPVLTVSGSVRPTDGAQGQPSRTVADRLLLNRNSGAIQAMGKVETVLDRGEGPVIMTAAAASVDPDSGWITYTQNARLVQGPNVIRGNLLRFHQGTDELIVEGNVESTLTQPVDDQRKERQYRVTSDQLTLNREDATAVYEGNVEVKSDDLDVEASRVVFHFTSQRLEELDRIVASGGVQIREKGRTWHGARAVYYGAEERVVILGDDDKPL